MTSEPGTGTAWIKQQQEEQNDRQPPARYSGVLAHPTSLPGPHGIGDLGLGTFAFLDWLARAKQNRWQILPLTPPGFGDSPYQSYSAFAGNPLLISLESLRDDGLLNDSDLERPGFPVDRVDFDAVRAFKMARLRRAAERFHGGQGHALRSDYERFVSEQSGWLDDYSLFMALKADQGDANWTEWPEPLRLHEASALADARTRLTDEIGIICFIQFVFNREGQPSRTRAGPGIHIIVETRSSSPERPQFLSNPRVPAQQKAQPPRSQGSPDYSGERQLGEPSTMGKKDRRSFGGKSFGGYHGK